MILGELEQKVMAVIWNSSESMKSREVLDAIGEEYAYTTIMTIMDNLYQKGILDREKRGITYYYFPKKSRSQVINGKLETIFNEILGSYKELAINKFLDTLGDSAEDIEYLEDYLKKLKNKKKKRLDDK
ncbi:MAG TPA: BlaI/MecI/CopY family transcriptional regulator [Candidatus Woesebacteria bacterium]|nr:BlaI/MecI/CopY family transcriptional regulator [Candidatus Woesebacteria bacterium]